jgi:hypothetical protein
MAGSCDPPALQINLGYSLKTVKRELERTHRVHRSKQNWDLPAGWYVNVILELLQFHHPYVRTDG